MRLKYRAWALPFLKAHDEIVFDFEEVKSEKFLAVLDHPAVVFEIGAGKGDFIIGLAEKNPTQRFIAVEKNLSAAAITAKKVFTSGLKNVFVVHDDVMNFIESIPTNAVKTIFLNFSDPWPKVRHTKRRLTSDRIIGQYARILFPKGEVRMKTDNVELFDFSLANFRQFGWTIRYLSYSYDGNDAYDAMSEYEQNFRLEGIPICRLVAKKGSKTYVSNPPPTPTV